MDMKLLVALLPIVFMLHDFEEIIMFKPWLEKNRAEVARRFPRLDNVLRSHHDQLSTSAYAVAVLHEFCVIALITFASLYADTYHWWFGALAAFSLHLIVHIAQWLIYGKYVPVVITSILALPYCLYTYTEFLRVTVMTPGQMLLWAVIGVVLTLASFVPAFSLAARFEHWKNRSYLRS
ncbi:MAG: HXXEE domain-containing protein [Anaerolineae bacterium]|nr:HXXEE domain-containing protein [Anaerolineae bacterium]